MTNELSGLVFPLYSEERFNIEGNREQTMNYEDFNNFMALFYTPEELLQNKNMFKNVFRDADKDHDDLLNLAEFTQFVMDFDNYRNGDVFIRLQQLVTPYAENQEDDKVVIESLFRFFDADNSGGLDRNEIENFFANIPYNNVYNEQVFDNYDVNNDGTLDIMEFAQLLIEVNNYLISQGINNFVMFIRQIVSPEPVITEPIEQPDQPVFISQIPSPDTLVPGTQHTYGVLGNAFVLKPGVIIDNTTCMAIHDAARHLRNPALGLEILVDFNEDMGIELPLLTHYPTQEDVATFEGSVRNMLNEYLNRSEIHAFQNIQQRQNMIEGIIQLFPEFYDMDFVTPNLQYSGYVVVGLVFNFMSFQSSEFQTLWAENFVTDCIESYDATIYTYQLGNRISCPAGIVERILMAIGNILFTGTGTGSESESAAQTVLSNEELSRARQLRRTGLLNRWLELYYQEAGDEHVTTEGFITFIDEKIRESDSDNNPDTWREVINTFVTSPGVRLMLTGGAHKYFDRINISNLSFGKKHRKSTKRMVKTKRLRKYKKKMTRRAKKSRRRLFKPTKSSPLF